MTKSEIKVPRFLCDTWWYGMTSRVSDKKFEELARLRNRQGFTAVQVVVGVPPEVGPENSNAAGLGGPAWNLSGEFNQTYLENSRKRIKLLNSHGLSALVYGAWGQQIEWLGERKMKDWWQAIIETMDDLDVMYCLTGESDIWIGEEKKLLPNKSTEDLRMGRRKSFFPTRIVYVAKKVSDLVGSQLKENQRVDRHKKWSSVLETVSSMTDKPLFIHVVPNMTSQQAVDNPELLDAITVQTGQSTNTRPLLWKMPLDIIRQNPGSNFINLEPWYEGILGQFGKADQLYAYWASMMAGAHAYCYGAHGLWNFGDGKFLAHWGTQTLNQAEKLTTPQLIAASHKLFIDSNLFQLKNITVDERRGKLIKITRSDDNGNFVTYIPEVKDFGNLPHGHTFSPLKGEFVKDPLKQEQVVIISDKNLSI